LDTKQIAFVAVMSGLGAFLSGISISVAPFLTAAGYGTVALDLSHIATFISAIFGGAYVGAAVGFLGGVYAGYYFGYVGGSFGIMSLLGLPLGKALTGLLAGSFYTRLKVARNSKKALLTFPLTVVSYVPESIYTFIYFVSLVPFFLGSNITQYITMSFVLAVIVKGWVEIVIMSALMTALMARAGFRQFVIGSSFFKVNRDLLRSSKKTGDD
jgi:LytS/YehU family sensor histidine kinase